MRERGKGYDREMGDEGEGGKGREGIRERGENEREMEGGRE